MSVFRRLLSAAMLASTCCLSIHFGVAWGADVSEIATRLDALKPTISKDITLSLQQTNLSGSYTTVWRQYEDATIEALAVVLPKHIPELSRESFDTGKAGREKNRTADFAIICGTNRIEISIKSARKSANPENDMGTFNDNPSRKRDFPNSFTVWVRYDDATGEIRCDRVFFDRTWRFVGKSTIVDGVKYRKKDGNMRPKPWIMFDSNQSYWATEQEFDAAVKRSETFRANELIKEHLQDMSIEDQRVLYKKLKEQFDMEKVSAE